MNIEPKPNMDDFCDEDGHCDFDAYDHAVETWESRAAAIPEVAALVPTFKDRMAASWETYHWVFETSDDKDLAVILAEAGGDVDAALYAAKSHTDLMNEMQSNCY